MNRTKNIVIAGAGSIGTALGHILASDSSLRVILLTIEPEVADTINSIQINQKYFPGIRLHPQLKATTGEYVLQDADMIFMAIPSVAVEDYISQNMNHIRESSIIINLAKGFGKDHKTIIENLEERLHNPLCSLKGPAFARDMISGSPTAFTLATKNPDINELFRNIFAQTTVFLDFSDDVKGVELLSILKNIYAILLGILDAHYNSANLRFLFLTLAFNEMRQILLLFGGKEETLFKFCGYGDFSLTALNDLSRNRTLGLLIGKGFFTEELSNKVVLEGRNAVNILHDIMTKNGYHCEQYCLLTELYKIMNNHHNLSAFIDSFLNKKLTN